MAYKSEIKFDFRGIMKITEDAFEDAFKELAPRIEAYAKSNHRYQDQTGNLTRSTRATAIDDGLRLFASANYAQYIARGHGTWRPDPWLEDAMTENKKLIEDVIAKHLDKAFNKLKGR
jgi:hypothetical protein